jgi:hypothetical protein
MASHNKLTIEGLTELRAALLKLPQELASEAGDVVQAEATAAFHEMDAKYAEHEWTGNLRASLSMTMEKAYMRYGARAVLVNRAKHAYIAEYGTQLRRTTTGAGRGAMPPLHIFVPIAQRHRRAMVEGLIRIVERAGLIVSATEVELAA